MIEVHGVNKKYGELDIFKNLTVKFPLGKKILIKGINGSGKSVLLKLLVGYSQPDSGKIIINNDELGGKFDFIPDSGVSINAPEFFRSMTGKENLLYLAKIKNIATEEEILELAKLLKMEKVINKPYKVYSLGMKQKLRIIQAIMEKPKYLILDEPFDSLDQESQEIVELLLKKYVNSDRVLIFTSHNLGHEKFADIMYEIDNQKLIRK